MHTYKTDHLKTDHAHCNNTKHTRQGCISCQQYNNAMPISNIACSCHCHLQFQYQSQIVLKWFAMLFICNTMIYLYFIVNTINFIHCNANHIQNCSFFRWFRFRTRTNRQCKWYYYAFNYFKSNPTTINKINTILRCVVMQ